MIARAQCDAKDTKANSSSNDSAFYSLDRAENARASKAESTGSGGRAIDAESNATARKRSENRNR